MALWLKIFIIILALHYILAISILYLVLKDNLNNGQKPKKSKLIFWNLFVLFLPIIGPICYCIYRLIHKKNAPSTTYLEHTANIEDNNSLRNEEKK